MGKAIEFFAALKGLNKKNYGGKVQPFQGCDICLPFSAGYIGGYSYQSLSGLDPLSKQMYLLPMGFLNLSLAGTSNLFAERTDKIRGLIK